MNSNIIQTMFAEDQRKDALAVLKDMQLPTILRMRADAINSGDHPLLAFRLTLMQTRREQMKSYASGLIEGFPPLDEEKQIERFSQAIRNAQESCLRVLECADDQKTKNVVAQTAAGMAGSIELMASILTNRGHSIAQGVRREGAKTREIAQRIDDIADRMKAGYEQLRVVIAQPGPRVSQGLEQERISGQSAPA